MKKTADMKLREMLGIWGDLGGDKYDESKENNGKWLALITSLLILSPPEQCLGTILGIAYCVICKKVVSVEQKLMPLRKRLR